MSLGPVRLEQIVDKYHVAQRLAHLFAVHPEHPDVHPDAGKRAGAGPGL
jgi:hypothetical protein